MKLFIRVDGGNKIGMGHLYRMANLAEAITRDSVEIKFLVSNQESMSFFIERSWNVEALLEDNHIQKFIEIIKREKPDVVIIDKLDITEEEIKNYNKLSKIILLENTSNVASMSDVTINGIFGGLENRNDINPQNIIYNGPNYIILNNSIKIARNKYVLNQNCKKILVTLGGSDPKELVFKVIEAFKIIKQYNKELILTVVSGPAFNNKFKLKKICEELEDVTLYENISNMDKLFLESDMAIVSGGVTLYEALCVGIPCVVLSQVDHQVNTADRFSMINAISHLGLGENLNVEDLAKSILNLINDSNTRKKFHNRGKEIIDGLGIERVKDIIYSIGSS